METPTPDEPTRPKGIGESARSGRRPRCRARCATRWRTSGCATSTSRRRPNECGGPSKRQRPRDRNVGGTMSDDREVISHIDELVEREHALRKQHETGGILSDDERAELEPPRGCSSINVGTCCAAVVRFATPARILRDAGTRRGHGRALPAIACARAGVRGGVVGVREVDARARARAPPRRAAPRARLDLSPGQLDTALGRRVPGARVGGCRGGCLGDRRELRRVRPLVLDARTDVVWLDYSRFVVMSRVIRRSASRAFVNRELWNGNKESIRNWVDPGNPIRWAWSNFDRKRVEYEARFNSPECAHLRVARLRSPHDADAGWPTRRHLTEVALLQTGIGAAVDVDGDTRDETRLLEHKNATIDPKSAGSPTTPAGIRRRPPPHCRRATRAVGSSHADPVARVDSSPSPATSRPASSGRRWRRRGPCSTGSGCRWAGAPRSR